MAIPTGAILTCAILILVYQKNAFDVAMGVLLVTFCGALGAGAALTIVGLRVDRRLAALQLDFVSKVSHELKTPLTSIRMFVDTLKLGRVEDPERVDHCLTVISKETDRLSELIERLLSWGAMESGAFIVDLAPVPPSTVVSNAVSRIEPSAQASGVEVNVHLDDDVPDILADASALTDALLNLLTNALRYRGESTTIWVSLRARPDDAVAIAVRDEGQGIALKNQSQIFDRFYKADERYARSVGGTGLGLAIARHIVLAHGGQIEVDSKLGAGSTFTIRLPSAVKAADTETEAA